MTTASEKLKALDMGRTEDDAELCTMGKVDLLALRDALPQIVAVVEAAEDVRERLRLPIDVPLRDQLAAALAALDEALS